MKFDLQFLRSPTGQLVTVGVLVVVAMGFVAWQRSQRVTTMPSTAAIASPVSLPRIFQRAGAKFAVPVASNPTTPTTSQPALPEKSVAPAVLTLTLFAHNVSTENADEKTNIPYGQLIPCETVFPLESNQLDTPIIGLVNDDVWHHGQLLISAGTEVHGRVVLDRARERLSAQGRWTLIRPSRDVMQVEGLALERVGNHSGDYAGSTGLRGTVLRPNNRKEAKLFAATFLATATAALQDTRITTGLLGETVTPAATMRNATLAGTSAVLRDYAQQLRQAVEQDGIYIRVPAGTPFYLYITPPTNSRDPVKTADSESNAL